MRDVMEQYGKAILGALVASLLFSIVFAGLKVGETKGLPAILGAETKSQGVDYATYKDAEQSAFVMEKERPKIRLMGTEIWTESDYVPEDLFAAEDAEGNPAKISILEIADKTGQEMEAAGDSVMFESQGVYRVLVRAIDSYCGVTENEFLVPVRRR
ncbi:MAG: hypothetical protein NC307_06715 [Roseburia sp.]|nr:hypothetical protein [Roseburia sp.]